MGDILYLDTDRWSLTIWTRDHERPRQLLKKVLADREKELPKERLLFNSTSNRIQNAEQLGQPLKWDSDKELSLHEPICYENRDYEFEFTFKGKGVKPDPKFAVKHRLKEVEESFRTKRNVVRGVLNFGNNVGQFKFDLSYTYQDKNCRDSISFKVWPVKVDMQEDLDNILKVIDEQYPLWRFSLAQKTDSSFARSRKKVESFEILWVAHFKSMATSLEKAIRLICSSPHNRLLEETRYLKADKIRGKIKAKQAEKIRENIKSNHFAKKYRVEKKKISVDTPENRFIKMLLGYAIKKLKSFCFRVAKNERREQKRLSAGYFEELEGLYKPFERLLKDKLFKEVGDFQGLSGESLVLHERMGYAKAYRIWQDLKLYLDVLGNDSEVSIKSMEQLYEIWCFIEIRNILMDLGFEEDRKVKGQLKTQGFEKTIQSKDKFLLSRSDGIKVQLIHEPKYSFNKNTVHDKIYSWTTTQKPDIYLEATLKCGNKVRWVFDAKYRVDTREGKTWPKTDRDTVPDDAINQMHRYRDSLIHISKADELKATDKSRPIIGAYALYPGYYDQRSAENPYQESIEQVGIGAFSFLPTHDNKWLKDFLVEQLGLE